MMFCSAVSLQLEGSELLENQSEMFSGKTKAIKSKASVRFLKLVQMFLVASVYDKLYDLEHGRSRAVFGG